MNIKTNIEKILNEINPYKAVLVAVTKTKPIDALQEAYNFGIRDFGENKVQELVEKEEKLPKDIKWHMIGHLQRNKVKYIAPFVYLIHAVDSLKLLQEINKQGKKSNRIIKCLLQVHIAEEETKFGFSMDELTSLFDDATFDGLKNIQVKGLMGMATFTENADQVRKEFKGLKELYQSITDRHDGKENVDFEILSMGMSGDFRIALDEGSTMVRVGSSIFGERN